MTAAPPRRTRKPAKPVKLPETTEGFPDTSTHDIKAESNPFTSPDWRMLGYAWTGFAVRVFIVLGGLFTVYQYLETREQGRVERTLQLVNLWEQPQYQEAQAALQARLDALNRQHAGLLGADALPSERQVYFRRIGLEAMQEDGGEMALAAFRAQFERIVYFLNRLAFCVDAALCSREVADAFFRDFAESFWAYFSGHVEQVRRQGDAGYAGPIEAYVAHGG